MGLTNWNPARDMLTLRDAMNRLFEDSMARAGGWVGERAICLPIDAYSTDEEIVVSAAVPGVKPEDVEITYEGDALTIRGEIPARLENANYLYTEQMHGPFSRTLQLNVPIDADKIEATFENGILTLVLPKAETAKPRVIKATVKK